MLNLDSSERMLRKIDLSEKLESRFVELFLYQLRGKPKISEFSCDGKCCILFVININVVQNQTFVTIEFITISQPTQRQPPFPHPLRSTAVQHPL